TSKAESAGPSRDWLTFVASPRAKTKVKQWFAKERREEAIEAGKESIAREARRTSFPMQRLVSAESMTALAREMHFPDVSGLYAAVGEGHASARHVVQRLVEVAWSVQPGSLFLVAIQVEALDRHRLLSDVTKVLADERVNILSAFVQTSRDRVAVSRFTFEMGDPKHLGHVLRAVRNVE